MIVDTHLHLINKSALTYPWLGGVPALDRDFLYSTYEAEARRVGIDTALHMEVDVDPREIEMETSEVGQLSRREGSLLKGAIAACRPEEDGFAAYLERQQGDPLVKGFRRVLHVVPDDLSDGAVFRENLKRLAGSRFTFDLCVLPHQIPKAIALADLVPDLQFVLDHCGVPDIRSGAEHPWCEHISEIARRPNVVAKISGVVAYADESWNAETLRPYVEHTIGVFGWDRVVWGSDWPVCTLGGNLSTWVATTHALLNGCSPDERTKLLSANARRIWRLA
ncbi:amidohydrolase family protein [Sinorhizobium mexicanum]|uniref:Amidohydrolase family protein n=1 Tax=Sinorhizobium mexicanum TaxID=375549 RepID=A0A859QH55_9HYPH|nr:amidohydrolase [Sinorhizobium mexicanum]MBP1884161.1 putative TIM-barrel fold metal-dependent hydrolase [Sinorhizobium mexicanum]QLL64872.1 amidohydrolase family protein [Sinorhizobium mexicanum]